MNKENYQKKLDSVLCKSETAGKTLFLHCCCAPCSSYVLEYLGNYFRITVFYYNPNITEEEEYRKRVTEQKRLIEAFNKEHKCKYPIEFQEGTYDPENFLAAVKGHEEDPEGGDRCKICFALRLEEAARLAGQGGYDYRLWPCGHRAGIHHCGSDGANATDPAAGRSAPGQDPAGFEQGGSLNDCDRHHRRYRRR